MTRTYCERRLLCLTDYASKTGFHFSWIFGGFDRVDIIFLVYMIPTLLPVFLWHLTNTLQRRARMNLNLNLRSSCKVLEDFVESGGGEKLASESLQSEVNDVIVVRNIDFRVTLLSSI